MAFKHYLEEEDDKPYFTTNSLGYYYDKMEGFAEKVEQAAKILNVTKEEVEKNITAYIEQNKNELDQRLAQWDGKLETFDSSVETLLTEWVDDGTLTPLIDSTLIDQKVAPLTIKLAETGDELTDFRDATGFSLAAIIKQFNLEPIPNPVYVENLWNFNETVLGTLSTTSGNVTEHHLNRTTGFVTVQPDAPYIFNSTNTLRVTFYSEEGGFIEGHVITSDTLPATLITPSNSKSMRVCLIMRAGDVPENVPVTFNIGSELISDENEGNVWGGGFWGEVPSPPLKEGAVKNRHIESNAISEEKLSLDLQVKINSVVSGGDTGGEFAGLGEQFIYNDNTTYTTGQMKTIADVTLSSVVDIIEFSSDGLLSELQIYYKESGGAEFLYDLVSNVGSPSIPNTFENLQIHGSAIAEFVDFDDRNNVYKIYAKDLKFSNGFKVIAKNTDAIDKNIAVRVVSRQYA